MAYSRVVRFDALRTIAFGAISGTYAKVGTPLTKPMRLVKFLNTSNVDLVISFDAINDHIYMPTSSFDLIDLNSNQDPGNDYKFQIGTQIYVKQAAGAAASGGIYVMAAYGLGE